MSGGMKIILGLLIMIVGLWVYLSPWFDKFFGRQFWIALKLVIGNLPGLVILIGLVMLLLGISDAKS